MSPCLSWNSGFFFQSNQGAKDCLVQEETSILLISTQLLLRSAVTNAEKKVLFLEARANDQH